MASRWRLLVYCLEEKSGNVIVLVAFGSYIFTLVTPSLLLRRDIWSEACVKPCTLSCAVNVDQSNNSSIIAARLQ